MLMAKVKGELPINQEVIPYKALSVKYVSDIFLGIEDKMMNKMKSLLLWSFQ